MPEILLKSGELIEIPEDEMLSFLQKNRNIIQDRISPRKRPIKRPTMSESTVNSTK